MISHKLRDSRKSLRVLQSCEVAGCLAKEGNIAN